MPPPQRAATSQQASKTTDATAGLDHRSSAASVMEQTSTPMQAESPGPGMPASVGVRMPHSPPKVFITLI